MTSVNDYIFEKMIGRGSFAKVYRVINKNNKQIYAIKKLKIAEINKLGPKYIVNEIKFLACHNCTNIINYHTVFLDASSIYVVMQYAQKGDLLQLIKKHKINNTKFTEKEILHYFTQICFALQYLHKNNIIHRDIKSSNIFIDNNNSIKIGDFGIIKIMQNYMMYGNTLIGTPLYMSPEIYKNERYNTKTDIWSLGCTLYEMMALTQPFNANNIHDLKYKIFLGKYSLAELNMYSNELKQLLKTLLSINSYIRPSIDNILSSNYIKNYIKQNNIQLVNHFNIKSLLNKDYIIPRKITDWERIVKQYKVQNIDILPKISNPQVKEKQPINLLNKIPPKLPPKILPQLVPTPSIIQKPEVPRKHIPIKPPIPTRYVLKPQAFPEALPNITPRELPKLNHVDNKELIQINNDIKQLYDDITNRKKTLVNKINQLEYYKKKRQNILNDLTPLELIPKIPFPIINEQIPTCNNKILLSKDLNDHIPTKPKLLIKIGSRHENNNP